VQRFWGVSRVGNAARFEEELEKLLRAEAIKRGPQRRTAR
jgi:hypothetical protein